MADNTQKMSYHAGEAKAKHRLPIYSDNITELEKANTMMDKATNAAQLAKESIQNVGGQMQAKAQGAADAVKDATGMNK